MSEARFTFNHSPITERPPMAVTVRKTGNRVTIQLSDEYVDAIDSGRFEDFMTSLLSKYWAPGVQFDFWGGDDRTFFRMENSTGK